MVLIAKNTKQKPYPQSGIDRIYAKAYPRTVGKGQIGGCNCPIMTLSANKKQAGGFPPLAVLAAGAAAIHKGLSTFKPFSKANTALHSNFSEHKDRLPYKILDKITGTARDFGYGKKRRKHRK